MTVFCRSHSEVEKKMALDQAFRDTIKDKLVKDLVSLTLHEVNPMSHTVYTFKGICIILNYLVCTCRIQGNLHNSCDKQCLFINPSNGNL